MRSIDRKPNPREEVVMSGNLVRLLALTCLEETRGTRYVILPPLRTLSLRGVSLSSIAHFRSLDWISVNDQ